MAKEREELGWDDLEIDPAEVNKPRELLPEGEAMFTVLGVKKSRREVGKLGVCNIADVALTVSPVDGDDVSADIEVGLPLHRDMLWKILAFFTALGKRKHGDTGAFKPDFDAIKGEVGRCVIGHRKYNKRDGTEGIANDITRWLAEGEKYEPEAKKGEARTSSKPKSKLKF